MGWERGGEKIEVWSLLASDVIAQLAGGGFLH